MLFVQSITEKKGEKADNFRHSATLIPYEMAKHQLRWFRGSFPSLAQYYRAVYTLLVATDDAGRCSRGRRVWLFCFAQTCLAGCVLGRSYWSWFFWFMVPVSRH